MYNYEVGKGDIKCKILRKRLCGQRVIKRMGVGSVVEPMLQRDKNTIKINKR